MGVAFDPIALLGRLVAEPSCDPPGGELGVAKLVLAELQRLGIDAELTEFAPGRANVMGRVAGQGNRPAMVFSAHMDTTPTGTAGWEFDPFAGDVVDGRVRGRGTADMKGALVASIGAAYAIAERPTPLGGDVILAFTAGESANCIGARYLVEQGFRSSIGAFLCGEPSSLDLVIAEKAILWLEIETTGRLGHVSGGAGTNAIDAMVECLVRLKHVALDLPNHPLLDAPSVAVGRISGGSAVNVTPDRCVAEVDVRFGPGIDVDTVVSQLAAQLPAAASIRVTDFKAAVERAPDDAFVSLCADVIKSQTGNEPSRVGVSYYSDAAILLDGLDVPFAIVGPGDLGASGQPNESVSVENIHHAMTIYESIATRWLGEMTDS
ncbi:MAG: M20 family metallopeptidase [Pseudomonadota bacterium]